MDDLFGSSIEENAKKPGAEEIQDPFSVQRHSKAEMQNPFSAQHQHGMRGRPQKERKWTVKRVLAAVVLAGFVVLFVFFQINFGSGDSSDKSGYTDPSLIGFGSDNGSDDGPDESEYKSLYGEAVVGYQTFTLDGAEITMPMKFAEFTELMADAGDQVVFSLTNYHFFETYDYDSEEEPSLEQLPAFGSADYEVQNSDGEIIALVTVRNTGNETEAIADCSVNSFCLTIPSADESHYGIEAEARELEVLGIHIGDSRESILDRLGVADTREYHEYSKTWEYSWNDLSSAFFSNNENKVTLYFEEDAQTSSPETLIGVLLRRDIDQPEKIGEAISDKDAGEIVSSALDAEDLSSEKPAEAGQWIKVKDENSRGNFLYFRIAEFDRLDPDLREIAEWNPDVYFHLSDNEDFEKMQFTYELYYPENSSYRLAPTVVISDYITADNRSESVSGALYDDYDVNDSIYDISPRAWYHTVDARKSGIIVSGVCCYNQVTGYNDYEILVDWIDNAFSSDVYVRYPG